MGTDGPYTGGVGGAGAGASGGQAWEAPAMNGTCFVLGEAGFIATIIALAAVLLLMPLLGVLLLRGESAFAAQAARSDFGVDQLRRFTRVTARRLDVGFPDWKVAGLPTGKP